MRKILITNPTIGLLALLQPTSSYDDCGRYPGDPTPEEMQEMLAAIKEQYAERPLNRAARRQNKKQNKQQ